MSIKKYGKVTVKPDGKVWIEEFYFEGGTFMQGGRKALWWAFRKIIKALTEDYFK